MNLHVTQLNHSRWHNKTKHKQMNLASDQNKEKPRFCLIQIFKNLNKKKTNYVIISIKWINSNNSENFDNIGNMSNSSKTLCL